MNVVSLPFDSVKWPFISVVFLTLLVIFLLRSVSPYLGLVDHPGGRKKHKNAVPLIGGVSIFIGVSCVLIQTVAYSLEYFVFWLSCFILVLLSVADDRYGLGASHRLIMQFILAFVVVVFGKTNIVHLGNLLGFGDLLLSHWSLLFTTLSLVGITNAVNMMDGVDGLTGCVSLMELSCLLFLSIYNHLQVETLIIVVIMGGILSFLLFNFPSRFSEKRKIFLGDAGSTLIGLALAWLCVRLSQMTPHHVPPVLMLWIMALPLMDTLHLMINRKMRGVSAFKADRRHIHHILLQLNYSPRQVSLILMSVSLIIGSVGIGLWRYGAPEWLLFLGMGALFCSYSLLSYCFKKRVSRRQYKFSIGIRQLFCVVSRRDDASSS